MTFEPEVPGQRHCDAFTCHWDSSKKAHIDFIEQNPGVEDASSTFVLDKSKGFTQAGVERLNDSIRTYVWALLGAQAQTRTRIVTGGGTSFDAQKQFIANIEDAISSPVDLPSAIKRYQNVLRYAGSSVDYVFGYDLYMSPSDMMLKIGDISGYNNEIVIATNNLSLGQNKVNESVEAPQTHGSFSDNKIAPNNPIPLQEVHPRRKATKSTKEHEANKTALVVGGIGVGVIAIAVYEFILK